MKRFALKIGKYRKLFATLQFQFFSYFSFKIIMATYFFLTNLKLFRDVSEGPFASGGLVEWLTRWICSLRIAVDVGSNSDRGMSLFP